MERYEGKPYEKVDKEKCSSCGAPVLTGGVAACMPTAISK